MKEIDRRGRTLNRVIMWGMWLQIHVLFLITFLTAPSEDDTTLSYVLFAMMSAAFTFGALYCGHYMAPRAYFSDEGVYLKYFFRKRFYPWGDMQQAVVLERKNNYGEWYEFYLLTQEGSAWIPGDTEKTYRHRNRRYLLRIPLTNESREYVKLHHVKLIFDESKGKRILWRLLK